MNGIREKILWWAALRRIRLDKPYIIAIGGGIAKTSTKVTFGTILAKALPGQSRVGFGNLNTYLGVPLAVLDFHLDFHRQTLSAFQWIWLLKRSIWRAFFDRLPKYLVLEYGTDQPGDIAALVKKLPPDMVLLTVVAPAHIANYPSLEAVAEDESTLIVGSQPTALVIVNKHDPFLALHIKNAGSRTVVQVDTQPETIATEFARSAAAQLGIASDLIEAALSVVQNPTGRFQIKQIGNFRLIDDSYNANPASMAAALRVLEKMPPPRVAVLGTMLEQGEQAAAAHRQTGEQAHAVAQIIIGVGEWAQLYRPNNHFSTSEEAAEQIFSYLPQAASILVKGSRGVHMEKIVDKLLTSNGNN
ncbi:MAG: cyanophycin synthetase [Patescibacteria group bacterium]